jgi:NitT/TauT family transport system permease protein
MSAFKMLRSGSFWKDLAITNYRVIVGFLLSVATAVPLGVLLGAYPQLTGIAGPVSNFGRYLPVAALVPLLILWAGVGDQQKILVLYVGTFFQLLVLTTDAVRRVPLQHLDSAATLGANSWSMVVRVLVPAAMPQIYDACRVAVGLTWSYVLVAEIVASEHGLGASIIRSQRFLQTDRIVFTIIVLGLLGLFYDLCFTTPRNWLFPWAIEEREN